MLAEQLAKMSLLQFWSNFGTRKRRAVLSNYKAEVYEACQVWLERGVVKRICFSFSICSLVFKLHEFKVAPFWKTPTHLQDSQFEESGPKANTLSGIPCDAYDAACYMKI